MFTQPCIIKKNTHELRNKLKKLGYKCNNGKWMGTYIATFKRDNEHDLFYCGTPESDMINNPSLKESIDCRTNEQLFISIAALRDDTDKNQWFTDGSEDFWFKLGDDKIDKTKEYYEKEYGIIVHKATVEELIEHFKTKIS